MWQHSTGGAGSGGQSNFTAANGNGANGGGGAGSFPGGIGWSWDGEDGASCPSPATKASSRPRQWRLRLANREARPRRSFGRQPRRQTLRLRPRLAPEAPNDRGRSTDSHPLRSHHMRYFQLAPMIRGDTPPMAELAAALEDERAKCVRRHRLRSSLRGPQRDRHPRHLEGNETHGAWSGGLLHD